MGPATLSFPDIPFDLFPFPVFSVQIVFDKWRFGRIRTGCDRRRNEGQVDRNPDANR